MKKYLPGLCILLCFLAGLGILLYPSVSNRLYERNVSRAVGSYREEVDRMAGCDKEEQLRLAREYNDALTGTNIRDPFIPGSGIVLPDNYVDILNVGNAIGFVEIPSIGVSLPVRHGTSEQTLQRAVGHIEATAFPVGGQNTHSVLTGHRGLAGARLFTDLDLLGDGDLILLQVLDETLAYEVDQILIVEPEDTTALRPVAGKDYLTLVTCTPYGVNSHRLLVRGSRVPYRPEELREQLAVKPERHWGEGGLLVAGFAVLWSVLGLWCWRSERRKRRENPRQPVSVGTDQTGGGKA